MEGQKPNNPFENLGGKEGTSSNPRQPVPNELREHIKELAIKGLSLGEIAKQVNRSKSTVSRIVKTLKLSKSITLVKAGRILIVQERFSISPYIRNGATSSGSSVTSTFY